MITLNEIRYRLQEEIRLSKLTQTEIAKRLGIKQASVAQYLSGRSMPSLETFANLCVILGASADEIFGLPKNDNLPLKG